ncbi:hypothetical protein ABFY60_15675 [Lysinibacillus pakistanensis]|uniref:hypothetical protein n=1 Tax=Lysinibacillus pakistanensis TaxID=759811 RepID=UPI003D2E6F35
MKVEVTKLLSERANKIENLKEKLHELQYGLDGSEVTHNGKEAVITALIGVKMPYY